SQSQEKLIKSLQTKKGREKSGLCLVEGEKLVAEIADHLEFSFTRNDSEKFDSLVTTETPQTIAAVARLPQWTKETIENTKTIVVLDGVQDPGNVGTILRLCLGFHASLLLIESADVGNPKVIRSSAGSVFRTPWIKLNRKEALQYLPSLNRPIYRLEKVSDSIPLQKMETGPIVLIAGSEGNGITLPIKGVSIMIEQNKALESLNVSSALAIALYERNR
ncbi:MAG: tRNA/rRNA methylase, partial [Candidatus Uhrbacteria bacterium GW2011_GWF2_40_263]